MAQHVGSTGEGTKYFNQKNSQSRRKLFTRVLPPKYLRFLIIILLLLGIYFRFINLDRKFYWYDEIYSSLRISGFSQAEMVQQVFNGHLVTVKELEKYQYPNPEKNLIDSISHSGIPEPQLPPLYFTLARFWLQIFGNSVIATRSFSAVVSLLAFPCIYWLCLELFKSSLVGWIAVGLMAVCPFLVLYAQEARPYSLWTTLILLSCASLLRAMRVKTRGSWSVYTVTLTLGFYTFLFFGLVAIAHGIYVLVIEKFKLTKTLKAYLISSTIGLIAFTPWLLFVITSWRAAALGTIGSWGPKGVTLELLFQTWIINLSRVFVDYTIDFTVIIKNPVSYLVIALIGYSIYFLCRYTTKPVWLFILSLTGVTGLALILPDLILRGILSGIMRYSVPSVLGIQLAVAYLFATKITSYSAKLWQQKLWLFTLVTLFSVGVFSCSIISQAEYWWNKGVDAREPEMVRIINRTTKPLLISEKINALGFSHHLDAKVKFQLISGKAIPSLSDDFSDVFLYRPSDRLRFEIERHYHTKVVSMIKHTQKMNPVLEFKSSLWKLDK